METITCDRCGETKPVADAVRTSQYRRGYRQRCRPCQARLGREHYARNRASYIERVGEYRKANPTKAYAKNAVNNAIASGDLQPAPCEVCGKSPADAHHDDYAKPLSVRWLCRTHHRLWHVENGEGANA